MPGVRRSQRVLLEIASGECLCGPAREAYSYRHFGWLPRFHGSSLDDKCGHARRRAGLMTLARTPQGRLACLDVDAGVVLTGDPPFSIDHDEQLFPDRRVTSQHAVCFQLDEPNGTVALDVTNRMVARTPASELLDRMPIATFKVDDLHHRRMAAGPSATG